jgi:PTH1 family peptidyl-tRNA hydrolase
VKLIVGLGNPGLRYCDTRHNIGFQVIDRLADLYEVALNRRNFDACWGKAGLDGAPALLVKPTTFMNLSGYAVQGLAHFFDIAVNDIIVIHDDLDLPFETIRLKKGGGDGGHKGVMSISEQLGDSGFVRVRLGIGRSRELISPRDYVLQSFSREERELLAAVLDKVCGAVKVTLTEGMQAAMNQYHSRNGVKKSI